MNIQGELKLENLVALQRDSFKSLPLVRKRVRNLIIVTLVLFLIIIFFINPPRQPINIVINIVAAVIFALLLPLIINKGAERGVRKSENSKRIGPFWLLLSEVGIEIERNDDSKQVPWKEIKQVTSDNEHFFLYYGERNAFVIPKSAIPSESQFIEYLSIYINKEKIQSRKRGFNDKQRRVVISVLVAVFVLLFTVDYFYYKPEYDISRAATAVGNLFVDQDLEDNSGNRIKDAIDQAKIDHAINELEKIDTSKSRYEKYTLLMLNLYIMVNLAQEQLNERMGIKNPVIEFTINDDLTPMENLLENIPELQASFDEIPWDIQGKILLPSIDDIPFNIEEVKIYSTNQPSAKVQFSGKGQTFTSSVWYYEEGIQIEEEIQLKNDIVGSLFYIEHPDDAIAVHWGDPEQGSNLLYGAHLASEPLEEEKIIKLANGMLANENQTYVNRDEAYIPEETDVVLRNNHLLENVERLEDFMAVAGSNNDSHVRVVKFVRGQGVIIYDLHSRYADYADEGWIEVIPDLTYYDPLESETQDVFNNAPQQCSELIKDVEKGFYKFYECRTHLEYPLVPVSSESDTQ